MVVGRTRFDRRADVRGVLAVVALGLATLAGAALLVALVLRLALPGAGLG